MGIINLAGYGLAIGAMGQTLFYSVFFPHLPIRLICIVLLFPWLPVHTISFCRQPPCGPRTFRITLIVAMIWYALLTAAAELIHLHSHPAMPQRYYYVVARAFMYLPALSFAVFIWFCVRLRRFENAQSVDGHLQENDSGNLQQSRGQEE